MVVELVFRETLDVMRDEKAKWYLDRALNVINFMERNDLEGINNRDTWFMALDFSRVYYKNLYGENNHCRALASCKGRLPSAGNTLCYFSSICDNIEVALIDKENGVYFSLDLYTSTLAHLATGVMFDTEKRR